MSQPKEIATQILLGQRQGEDKFEIRVVIGMPYKIEGEIDEWACPVVIVPFVPERHDVHGEGSLQALCLAVSAVYQQLNYFIEDGGKLSYETGEGFDLKAAFGRSYR